MTKAEQSVQEASEAKPVLSNNALWSMLTKMRSDETAGTSVSAERKLEALLHLCAHLGASLGMPLSLDLESFYSDREIPMGSCHLPDTPSAIPSFSVSVDLSVNTREGTNSLAATALIFFYLGNERITFPQRDYVWCSFEAAGSDGEVADPKWHFPGWQRDVYEEYVNW